MWGHLLPGKVCRQDLTGQLEENGWAGQGDPAKERVLNRSTWTGFSIVPIPGPPQAEGEQRGSISHHSVNFVHHAQFSTIGTQFQRRDELFCEG